VHTRYPYLVTLPKWYENCPNASINGMDSMSSASWQFVTSYNP
jgi:hypothetical protein